MPFAWVQLRSAFRYHAVAKSIPPLPNKAWVACRVRDVVFILALVSGLTVGRPAFAQNIVVSCQNYRLVHNGQPMQPPLRIRDSVIELTPDQMRWAISFVKEDGGPTRPIAMRINRIQGNQVTLYESNMGGQSIVTILDGDALTYSHTEYSLYGKIREQSQGLCTQSQ